MAKFAILSGDIVTNIIIADSLEEANKIGNAIEYTSENPAFMGGKYNFETGKFLRLSTKEESIEETVVENA